MITLEDLYNYESACSNVFGSHSFEDLINFINNHNDSVGSEYTGSDDDWIFSNNGSSSSNSVSYHNDIHLHEGYHYCSRSCKK